MLRTCQNVSAPINESIGAGWSKYGSAQTILLGTFKYNESKKYVVNNIHVFLKLLTLDLNYTLLCIYLSAITEISFSFWCNCKAVK